MAAEQHLEPPAWLKTLPVAPEYRPTLAEFLDPIAFILRIEKEASQYGICKIIPPLPPPPKSSALANLTRSLAGPDPVPTFSTRKQQVGLCPRRPRPVQRSVWQSGERYTLPQFEEKVRQFERTQLKRVSSTKKSLSPLETETLFWRSSADKPFTIEYANDMPGSCFNPHHEHHLQEEFQPTNVGETGWNMRGVSRERGSLLRFMKEEIPGVTSPMVYVAMMYSWFAWHVEDHDLHSMNYLHFGSGKTWYGVPRDARLAFEEAVRVHGYGEEVNPLVTFTMLGEKTTVMSPEVLVGAGIPCCRLVQNAGEFVVTFPGAYHSGFSHGFNCAEAANIATPGWLSVAKDAAIRRASTNTPPMVSHYQLLYSLALSVWPRAPKTTPTNLEPKSSRLKDKTKTKNEEAETMVKETFVESMMENNNFISMLVDRGGSCVILPRQRGGEDGDDISNDDVGRRIGMGMGMGRLGFGRCQKGHLDGKECKIQTGLLDEGLLSCVMCGILSFACVAVVQPREKAAKYLMSNANCSFFRGRSGNSDDCSSSDVDCDNMPSWEDHDNALFVTPIAVQDSNPTNPTQPTQPNQPNNNNNTALALLASAYSASDSDNDEVLNENSHFLTNGEVKLESRTAADGDVVKCDKDSSRKHVFCLEHALKVWREMQRIGGADVILLCHPEYPKIEAEAKRMARELGMIYHWKEFNFRDSSEAHKQQIKSALEDEEAVPTKSDWAVKMGINLYYSASQSKSPLYSKQMPYNKIIYKVFGQEAGLNEDLGGSGVGRRKRIVVAGRWCGKVWMTNQVHPYLASLKEESNNKEDLEGEKLYFRVPVDEGFERGDSGGSNSKNNNNSRVLKRVCGGKTKEVGLVGQGRRSGRLTGVKIEESKAVVVVERETCSTSKRSQRVRRKPAKFASCYVSSEDEKGEGEGEKEGSGDETSSSHKCGTGASTARQRKTRSVRKTRVSDESILDEIERDSDSELEKEPVRTRGKTRSVRKTRVSDESIKNDSEYESEKELVRTRGKTRSIRKTRVSDESILDEIDQGSDNESEKEPVRTKGRKNSSVRKTRVSDESILDEIDQDSENVSEDEPVRTKGRKNSSVRTTRVPDKIEQDTDYEFEPEPVAKPKGRKRQKQKHEIQSNLEFKCDIELCPMSFSSKQDLTTHKKNICHIKGCNKKFFSHKYMFSHQKVHIDERPLKCPWKGCKMAFKWPWARTEHIRVHTGARPYVCKEPGCGQTFRFVSDFSRHKRKTGHNSKGKKREK